MDTNIVGRLCQTPAPINSTTDQTDITDIVKETVAAASPQGCKVERDLRVRWRNRRGVAA